MEKGKSKMAVTQKKINLRNQGKSTKENKETKRETKPTGRAKKGNFNIGKDFR